MTEVEFLRERLTGLLNEVEWELGRRENKGGQHVVRVGALCGAGYGALVYLRQELADTLTTPSRHWERHDPHHLG